ncbi:MAG: hypothetical protein GY710_13075 [Desulfobacteraceae bacterium]|nr:hypothetical protein [Desulfobacteraceae bacterium]
MSVFIGVVFGGLAATFVTLIFSNIRTKHDRAVSIVEYFSKELVSYTQVIDYLDKPSEYIISEDEEKKEQEKVGEIEFKLRQIDRHKHFNEIVRFCMWFNLIAFFYVEYKLNREILDVVGLPQEMESFWESIEENKQHFKYEYNQSKYLKKMKGITPLGNYKEYLLKYYIY